MKSQGQCIEMPNSQFRLELAAFARGLGITIKESAGRIINGIFARGKKSSNNPDNSHEAIPEEEVCCNGIVHIAYRGVSDDRMYISHSRHWREIKYFRPQGLKVFCADCRTRVL